MNLSKIIITAFLPISFLTTCTEKPIDATALENQNLINRYFELFNQHKWAELSTIYSEDTAFKDPSLGTNIVKLTREQFITKYTELNSVFPNLKDSVIQMYTAGKKHIIVEFVATGNAEDGTRLALPICTVFTIENGKIVKDFTYYDN